MPRENYVKEQVPEGVVLASKTSVKGECRQPQEQYPTCNMFMKIQKQNAMR